MITLPIETASQEAARREAFLRCWRARNQSLRHGSAVLLALDSPGSEELRRWIAEDERDRRRRHILDEQRLIALRAGIHGISPMLLEACRADDISVAAVAYGVLPNAHMLLPGDGHPWLDASEPERMKVVRASALLRMSDGWERRHYSDGAFVRSREHPSGRFGVRVLAGVLHVDMEVDGMEIRSSGRHCSVRVPAVIPAAAQAAARGRRVSILMEHRFLADPAFVITSVADKKGKLEVRFRCEPTPLRIADIRPDPGREWQQLGRDGSLGPERAARDLLERCHAALALAQRPLWAAALQELAAEQVRTLNMMSPPWGTTLEMPSFEVAEAFTNARRSRAR